MIAVVVAVAVVVTGIAKGILLNPTTRFTGSSSGPTTGEVGPELGRASVGAFEEVGLAGSPTGGVAAAVVEFLEKVFHSEKLLFFFSGSTEGPV